MRRLNFPRARLTPPTIINPRGLLLRKALRTAKLPIKSGNFADLRFPEFPSTFNPARQMGGEMAAELRRLKRRLDWLETFATVVDSRMRTLGLRVERHWEECEPGAHNDRESKVRAAMGPQDAKLFRITELLHALAARQDAQADELANLAMLLDHPAEGLTEGKPS